MRSFCIPAVLSIFWLGCAGPPRAEEVLARQARQEQLWIGLKQFCDELAASVRAESIKRNKDLRYLHLAVAPRFEGQSRAIERNQLDVVLRDYTAYCLREANGLNVVERAHLDEIWRELELAEQTGDLDAVARIPQLVKADAVVTGSLHEIGSDVRMTGTALLLDAQSMGSASVHIPLESLEILPRVPSGRFEAAFRSFLPGWGQLYNDEPVKAGLVMGLEAGVLGTALGFHLSGLAAEDRYRNEGRGCPKECGLRRDVSARTEAEDAYTVRNVLLYTALGLWALNIADAWFNGYQYDPETAFEGRFGRGAPVVVEEPSPP